MAGETTKTTALSDIQSGTKRDARLAKANLKSARDNMVYAATELELADVKISAITLPSNAIVSEVLMYNDDLDSNATPTLALDIGLAAGADFTSVTSSVETDHSEDDILDADLFVDGDITAQSATTKLTSLALDAVTAGPDDINKALWELLGYDEDPRTEFRVAVTVATAAATAAAGDCVLEVRYLLD